MPANNTKAAALTPKQGKLVILIVGPSGAGKGTLMHELERRDPRIKFFITATTRSPRHGEYDGVHYRFLTHERFNQLEYEGAFLETDDHYEHRYGTLKSIVEGHLVAGDDVITDLNWAGVAQIQKKMPEEVFKILILPPNIEELKRRFAKRAATSKEDPAKQQARLEKIITDFNHIDTPDYTFTNEDMAGSQKSDYDTIIVNDNLETAITQALAAINERRTDDATA